MYNFKSNWIWSAEKLPARNAFVRFRRRFGYAGGPARLRITADSRYILYVNGAYMGQGPVRAWPNHWHYDTYDLEPYLTPGRNILGVLVNHFGEGNFQYIPGPPGLLAELELGQDTIGTDDTWLASSDPAFTSVAPRLSVQQGFEEQYDARADYAHADYPLTEHDWRQLAYDDVTWGEAAILRSADDGWHRDLKPRGIPFLTLEPVLPQRLVSVEVVRSLPYRFTVYVKPYLAPQDRSSNMLACHAYLATRVWSPEEATIQFILPHKQPGPLKVNGQQVEGGEARLHPGWNSLVASIRGIHHLPEFAMVIDGLSGLRFCASGDTPGSPWAVVGPFDLGQADRQRVEEHMDTSLVVTASLTPEATCACGEAFWREGEVASVVNEPYFQPVKPEHLPTVDVFLQAYTERPIAGNVLLEHADGLISGAEWTTVYPTPSGEDVRLLLDYGREVVGYHRFEIQAPIGTVVDIHNFEFIQPDGHYNFAEGMNNSLRYICRQGRQVYQTILRRGFQYTYLVLRNFSGPVRLGRVEVLFSTYPQSRKGMFVCSDEKLNRIWEVGAHTLRCSAEDTYVDCPTYEQTHWVGDARNEALVDWVVNGDPRLWYRCLAQTAQSLERSPITESEVPSAWQNILSAWSFLWMRSCREYLLYTGDREGAMKLLDAVARNIKGIKQHINAQGLYEIHAWNMFDWADMDTPTRGVVTHNNCQAVQALNAAAEMAEWLGRDDLARDWVKLAGRLKRAVNIHLWNEAHAAYTDCLRDGQHSPVYSQQTQTAAYVSGVAAGKRARRCRAVMHNPPEGFVRAGSPFFEFFLLEAYQREGKQKELLETIRRDWGFMIDMGATTFWEQFAWGAERLTRSHCHGWSAAPTYFLSNYVLGVQPGGPGFQPLIIEPHPAGLTWCRGRMPTSTGDVEVQWQNPVGKPFEIHVLSPDNLQVEVRLPRPGTAMVNGKAVMMIE